MLPAWNDQGNLSVGVPLATEDESLTRLATVTMRRWLGERLCYVIVTTQATSKLGVSTLTRIRAALWSASGAPWRPGAPWVRPCA